MSADPARLYTALLNTGLQQKDNALYQVIRDLIAAVLVLANSSSSSSSSSSSGLTNAQIMARILLDSGLGGGGSSSGLTGATGPAGPIGPTGVGGPIGPTIIGSDVELEDLVLFRSMHLEDLGGGDQSFYGNMKPSIMQMFSWTAKSVETVYQALSDGLVVVYVIFLSTDFGTIQGLTDSANPPTTQRAGIARTSAPSNGDQLAFTMPVKKGDFYKIHSIASGGGGFSSVTINWVPLGVNG